VDVVSHLTFGRALVALSQHLSKRPGAGDPPPARRRALSAAIIVGAIAPDLDAVLMPFGRDRYLVWHERGTHTFLGILLVAALLASLLRFVIQPLWKRPRTPWRLLWLAAIVGCASHLLLDAVCGGSLHPLWPLTDARLTFSLVGMADPLLAIPLVLFLIVAAIWRRRAFELAMGVLIVMTVVLGAKAVSRREALRAFDQRRPSSSTRAIEARWASLSEWYVYERDETAVRTWEVDARSGRIDLYIERPAMPSGGNGGSGGRAALIEASNQLDTVKRARSLFEFNFPEVIPRQDGTFDVLWSDIRFCRPDACDLRFGGRFDGAGRALEQVVIIGQIRQTRPVPASASRSGLAGY
jgi:membrane-bound metal-dependent hydrolase YbcI (DUF457 family)